ncbi:MAG: MBL fold metallo-hydrolase [Gammaproteobacteria bacterium]|jgi:glyoxylase-like metal-dependent hydrolase (beta-lactamase superfamily II)|nr:MBL fold metallo-hydrolase [Gammaproteobacteria bacterium]MBT4608191.1 MBL fold metallo-hydrolase [Thiotrichales bacterium]MBT3472195.1 MBL fold metallo-hydrolase [Gammaproteobacteria bacterium]MBT3965992.1 MBL fold metallo-hydrolase [Gammaproteobacteria bacterium]MBT4079916.1 MBL fold metallo-hydrolase [Gammaproteobacteria bacterium]
MERIGFVTLLSVVLFSMTTAVSAEKMVRDYPLDQLTDHTWVIHGPKAFPSVENQGFMNNPGIVLSDAGVVVVDPGSSLYAGEMVLRMVRQITDAPVVAVFNTHVHGDHWFGNDAIHRAYPDAPIYAHPQMIADAKAGEGASWNRNLEKLTEGFTAGTSLVFPTVALNHGDEVKIGNLTFRMHHYGEGHSKTDMMIEVVEDQTVFLGDNAMVERLGGMQSGTFQGNIAVLNEVLKSEAKTWVPGHGTSGDRSVVTTYRDYLAAVYDGARYAFNEDLDSSEVKSVVAKRTTAYQAWAGYDFEMGRHANQAYLEVEASEF